MSAESPRKLAECFCGGHQPLAAPPRIRRGGVLGALAASLVLTATCWWLANRQEEPERWRRRSDCVRFKLARDVDCDEERPKLPRPADAEAPVAEVLNNNHLAAIEPNAWPARLATRESQREESSVVQTAVLDAEAGADQPGFCNFSEAALPPASNEPAAETTAHIEYPAAEPSEPEAADYPTTELEPTEAVAPPEAVPPAPPMRRPLPGPVNMVTGHDPSGAVFATGTGAPSAADRPREKVLSRLSRAWREKLSRPAAGAPADNGPPDAPAVADPLPPREPVSAAASDVWYNRRWR